MRYVSRWHHFFRVYFRDGTSRRVLAQSEQRAKRIGEWAQRLVGYRKDATRAVSATDEGHAGTGQEHCPRCRCATPSLFQPDEADYV